MPIRYVTPAPVGLAGSIYADGAMRRRQAAASAGGGYGRADAAASVPYDTGIQEAIQARDQLSFARTRDALDRNTVSAPEVFRAQAAADMQRQRFQLEAELKETELTQQEKMRLFRMKNAIGAIANDPTWGPEDRAAAIAELKTGIDPLEKRAARERVQAQAKMFQDHADQRRMQAALDAERLNFMTGDLEKRQKFIPDPTALAAIAADLKESFGTLAEAIPPALVKQMAEKEALAQGLGVHGILDSKGEFVPFDKDGGKTTAGKAAEATIPNGMDAKRYEHAVDSARKAVLAQAKETIKDENLMVKPKYPDLQDPESQQRAVEKILFDQGLPAKWSEFFAQAKTPEAAGPKGYNPANASWNRARAKQVATVATEGEQGPAKPTEAYQAAIADIDNQVSQVQAAGIPEGDKRVMLNILRATKEITAKYPDPSKMTDDDVAALVRLREQLTKAAASSVSLESRQPRETPLLYRGGVGGGVGRVAQRIAAIPHAPGNDGGGTIIRGATR